MQGVRGSGCCGAMVSTTIDNFPQLSSPHQRVAGRHRAEDETAPRSEAADRRRAPPHPEPLGASWVSALEYSSKVQAPGAYFVVTWMNSCSSRVAPNIKNAERSTTDRLLAGGWWLAKCQGL